MWHNVLICIWKHTHTHSLLDSHWSVTAVSKATFWLTSNSPLRSMHRNGKQHLHLHRSCLYSIYEQDVFLEGGVLRLQWLCSFNRPEACPISFIISSLTEVTLRPPPPMLRARLCHGAHVIHSHECQHPAEPCTVTRWSLSITLLL